MNVTLYRTWLLTLAYTNERYGLTILLFNGYSLLRMFH